MTVPPLRRYFSVRRVVALNSLFLILFAALVSFGQVKDTITLYQAIRDGKVVATFKGTGGSSGDAIEVEVAKTPKAGPGPLDLTIPPGSMLHSANGAEQSMVVMGVEGRSTGGGTFAPASHITVSSTRPVTYILSAFCAEFEKENPSTRDTFTLEEPVPMLTCLAREGKTMSIPAQQAAVWQYTDGMTFGRVNEKFTVSQTEWAAASRAVEHCRSAGTQSKTAPTPTLPSVRVQREKAETKPGQADIQASAGTVQAAVDAYVRGDSSSAMAEWQSLADRGNAFAQTWVAEMYQWGDGIPKNPQEAKRYYDLAAAQGDPWPNRRTGRLHFVGSDLRPPDEFAIQNSKVKTDYAEAAACFRRSAEHGIPVAQRLMGSLYWLGMGVPRDSREAINWWHSAVANNDIGAMLVLAKMYALGLGGLSPEPNEALNYYRRAADLGSPVALKELGQVYENGYYGIAKDYSAAESWYLKLRDEDPAAAQTRLQYLYFTIGMAHMQGDGFFRSADEAAKWFRKDVDVGGAAGAAMLADIYQHGQGVPKDYEESARYSRRYIELLREGVESGNGNSMRLLADAYRDGRYVSRDYSEAARLYRDVIEKHFSDVSAESSMFALGELYENGDGVPQDRVQAYMWLNLAATGPFGVATAKDERDKIERSMTKEQITEAQTLSRQWHDQHH